MRHMRASHIVYPVDDLDTGVEEWREKGFAVEYARKSKRVNALIMFSEGPFIELIDRRASSALIWKILTLTIARALRGRIAQVAELSGDRATFCIETDEGPLDAEIAFLKKHGKKGKYVKWNRRKDPKGKVFKWKLFFPSDLHLPFLMSYYNIDPKPKNFIHPNGAKRIKSLTLVTNAECIGILADLLDDHTVTLVEGDGRAEVVDVEYEYEKH